MRSEEEVNKMIADLKSRTKGKYITQGVSFNKTCPRQMDLLKKALMSSVSFSGLAKEMLALRFDNQIDDMLIPRLLHGQMGQGVTTHPFPVTSEPKEEKPKVKNTGNFI